MNLILVLARVDVRVPEEALHLRHHRTHGGEEGSQRHLVTVAGVHRLASLGEDQEVLSDLIELLHAVLDLYVKRLGIDVVPFEEELDRVDGGLGNGAITCHCGGQIFTLLQFFQARHRFGVLLSRGHCVLACQELLLFHELRVIFTSELILLWLVHHLSLP